MNHLAFLRTWILAAVLMTWTLSFAAGTAVAESDPKKDDDVAVITAFEQSSGPRSYSLSIAFHGSPRSELMLLQSPPRVVLDLFSTVSAVRPGKPEPAGLVSAIRDGLVSADRYRLILDLTEPAVPDLLSRNAEGSTVLELKVAAASPGDFRKAMATLAQDPDAVVASEEAAGRRRYTIVLDPGHGAEDFGAVGVGGTLEKDLNLAFGLVLKEALEEDPALRVVMTRTEDVLLPLAERTAVARREGADLFVSLHADSIRYRELRGATVYTLSDEASDPLSQELAEGENAADRFAGPEWQTDTPEIHDILVDLVRRETEVLSRNFAQDLVLSLRKNEIRLINNPRRSAGFRVLRAPDVPSVLLEIGYLSNKQDEKLMTTKPWQREMAEAVSAAIRSFLEARSAIAR